MAQAQPSDGRKRKQQKTQDQAPNIPYQGKGCCFLHQKLFPTPFSTSRLMSPKCNSRLVTFWKGTGSNFLQQLTTQGKYNLHFFLASHCLSFFFFFFCNFLIKITTTETSLFFKKKRKKTSFQIYDENYFYRSNGDMGKKI